MPRKVSECRGAAAAARPQQVGAAPPVPGIRPHPPASSPRLPGPLRRGCCWSRGRAPLLAGRAGQPRGGGGARAAVPEGLCELRRPRSGDSAAPDLLDSHRPPAGPGAPEPGMRGPAPRTLGPPRSAGLVTRRARGQPPGTRLVGAGAAAEPENRSRSALGAQPGPPGAPGAPAPPGPSGSLRAFTRRWAPPAPGAAGGSGESPGRSPGPSPAERSPRGWCRCPAGPGAAGGCWARWELRDAVGGRLLNRLH